MRGDLRVARRLHLGARRRQRCRGGRIFRRDRVRYAPPKFRDSPAPPRLPIPVRGASPGSPRMGPVGLPMRLQPALARASVAARAHRRARSAEHVHLSAPTTPPQSTFHAPLLLHRAAGRARRSRRTLPRGGRALNAFTTKARVTRPGPSLSPSRRSTSSPPRPTVTMSRDQFKGSSSESGGSEGSLTRGRAAPGSSDSRCSRPGIAAPMHAAMPRLVLRRMTRAARREGGYAARLRGG